MLLLFDLEAKMKSYPQWILDAATEIADNKSDNWAPGQKLLFILDVAHSILKYSPYSV